MNKILLAAALAVVAAAPFAAQADENNNQLDNFYVAGNLGQSNYRLGGFSDKNDVFQNVRFGWRWNGIVGAEIGYAYLGKAKTDIGSSTFSTKSRVGEIGLTGKYNFYQNWFVTGHGGYLRSRGTDEADMGDASFRQHSWNNGWYAGAGVGYDITKNVALGINYDNYHVKYGRAGADEPQANTNVAAYSASVEVKF